MVLDESLELDRAEQMRTLLLQLKAYEEIQVEQDVADQTPRLPTKVCVGFPQTAKFVEHPLPKRRRSDS